MITFSIPGIPPSTNTYWRHDRNVTHISSEGKNWRDTVAMIAPFADLSGKLYCEIAIWLPDNRRRDVDNFLKAMLDSLQYARVIQDDSQIRDVRVYEAGIDRDAPRTIVTLGDLDEREVA